jgi:hypothetical protein
MKHLLLTLAALVLSPAASAQLSADPAALAGYWTTRFNGDCNDRAHVYEWTVKGDLMRFVSGRGAVDVERIVERRGDRFTAVTVSSPSNPPGTRWEFVMTGVETVQVTNLSTRRTFAIRLCGDLPATR